MEVRKPAEGAERKLWDIIKEIRIAMMTTVDEDGTLRSRPMASSQVDFDGTLWFFTRASAPKVEEVRHEQQVNLSYAEPEDQEYVSVSGRAELVRDKAKVKELWSELLTTWFPKGADDPDLALLKVTVEKAEYWDSPSSAMVYAYGYAKAKVTGESPEVGDNRKLNFR